MLTVARTHWLDAKRTCLGKADDTRDLFTFQKQTWVHNSQRKRHAGYKRGARRGKGVAEGVGDYVTDVGGQGGGENRAIYSIKPCLAITQHETSTTPATYSKKKQPTTALRKEEHHLETTNATPIPLYVPY
jgi:hypothetical protein